MKKFVKALEPSAKSICYSKPYVYYYEGANFIFASACGHLFTTKMPEEISSTNKRWQIAHLDVPDIIPLTPIKNSQSYFKCIKDLSIRKDIDEIVVCTDPDREGQLIWALIAQNLSISIPVTRVWIKEWTKAGLSKAFHQRKDNKSYTHLELAGLCRMQADYLIGLTGTRVNTCQFGGYKNVINEGRVQSPTRYIVYLNEMNIKNFVPEKYSLITLHTTSDEESPLSLISEKLDGNEAQRILRDLSGQSYTIHKKTKQIQHSSPKLYKTNTILVDASNKLGLSAEQTTQILQKLYQDYGLTTYPRTEIEKISTLSAQDVMKIVNSLDGIGLVDDIINHIKTNNLSFQNHLINNHGGEMPHEAITPAFDGHPTQLLINSLSQNEKEIYKLIVIRFLQGFYPPAIFEETEVETVVPIQGKDYVFSNRGKIVLEESWMALNGGSKDSELPLVTDGQVYNYVDSKIDNKTTKPPARYTEATLLQAMENAGRFVENAGAKKILKEVKGIGTGATREGIIKGLYKSGFLIKKGKSIYPTEKTIQMMEILPNSPLTSPMMTADLETKLSLVENGQMTFGEFMQSVNEQIDEIIKAAQNAPQKIVSLHVGKQVKNNENELGSCPCCGKPMRENSKSYYCMGYKEGCHFSIWKEISGKKITKTTAKRLIEKGSTGKLKGFVSKRTGKEYEAKLVVNKANQKVNISFK